MTSCQLCGYCEHQEDFPLDLVRWLVQAYDYLVQSELSLEKHEYPEEWLKLKAWFDKKDYDGRRLPYKVGAKVRLPDGFIAEVYAYDMKHQQYYCRDSDKNIYYLHDEEIIG